MTPVTLARAQAATAVDTARDDAPPDAGAPDPFQLFVRYIRTLTVDAHATDDVASLEAAVAAKSGVPRENAWLVIAGKKLTAGITLGASGVRGGSTVHMAVRGRGGMPPESVGENGPLSAAMGYMALKRALQAAGVPPAELSNAPTKPALLTLAERYGLSVAWEGSTSSASATAPKEPAAEPAARSAGQAAQGETKHAVRLSSASAVAAARLERAAQRSHRERPSTTAPLVGVTTAQDVPVASAAAPAPSSTVVDAAPGASTALPSAMYGALTVLDDRLVTVLGAGDIRLVRSAWLLAQPAGYRIVRRQDLEALEARGVSPSPLMQPDEAVALVRRGGRSAGAVTHGWCAHARVSKRCARVACDAH